MVSAKAAAQLQQLQVKQEKKERRASMAAEHQAPTGTAAEVTEALRGLEHDRDIEDARVALLKMALDKRTEDTARGAKRAKVHGAAAEGDAAATPESAPGAAGAAAAQADAAAEGTPDATPAPAA